MKILLNVCLALAISASLASCKVPRTVEVSVIGEDRKPIQGADVSIKYFGYSGEQDKEIKGKSDIKGRFKATKVALLGIQAKVEKENYYTSLYGDIRDDRDHNLTCILRLKKKSIALYAKKFRGKVPGLGRDYGFDFEVGDWLAPQGKGQVADVFFQVNLTENEKGEKAGKLELRFANEEDGIKVIDQKNGFLMKSKLTMPNEAPLEAYQKIIERVESGYQNENKPKSTSYFLRTRAQKIDDNTYHFNYSKLKEGIEFRMGGGQFLEEPYRTKYPKEYGAITFTYYFNPTPNDRNLEFDPKKNLFPDEKIVSP